MAGTYDDSDRYELRALVGSSNVSDIDEGFEFLRDDVSALLAPVYFGARSSRPRSTPVVPGIAGRRYVSNGDLGIDLDTGTSWLTERPGKFSSLPTLSGHGSDGIDEGMEILFQTAGMAAAGVGPWYLRYDPTLSGTAKWKVLSAEPVVGQVNTQESTPASTTSYSDLTTVGPSATAPVAGLYYVAHEALMGGIGTDQSFMTGGAGASASDRIAGTGSMRRTHIAKTLTAGDVVKAQVRSVGGIGTFEARTLSITPRRVG